MKTALIFFLFSFSAMASDCYVRTVELVSNDVFLAREICIEGIDLNLEVFGNSKALIRFTLDGVSATKEVSLTRPIQRRDGKMLFLVYGLQSDYSGGMCGDTTEASMNAELVMNKDGSDVVLEKIEGSVSTSNDNCHSPFREIQNFSYTL